MKVPIASYNFNLLSDYFNDTEFSFINNFGLHSKELDLSISQEIISKNKIVTYLDTIIANDKSDSLLEKNLLIEAQDISITIIENIKILHDLKYNLTQLFGKTSNLLSIINSSPENSNQYINQIEELKKSINEFQLNYEEKQSIICRNHIKIDSFFIKNSIENVETPSFNNELDSESYIDNSKEINEEKKDEENVQEKPFNLKNKILRISEKENKVFLPYSKKELSLYLEQYPKYYDSYQDVIEKEFILPLDFFMKHPVQSRFRETYSLIRDRESKSVFEALKYAFELMFHYDLSPTIIAACKTQEELENYLSCLEKAKLSDFKDFEIIFEVNPI